MTPLEDKSGDLFAANDNDAGKVCTKCKVEKSISEFHKHKGGKYGVDSVCKPCVAEMAKAKRKSDPEKEAAKRKRYKEKSRDKDILYSRERYWSDPEAARAARREYYKNNRQASLDAHKVWRGKNKKYLAEKNRENYQKNREKILAEKAEERRVNPEKHRAAASRSAAKRYATEKGKLEITVKASVWYGIKRGSKCGRSTFDLLGYTVEELKSHLEKQFQPGMSWENYNRHGWHIDHKIPLSAHNYETPDDEDFKRAWALSNLQPLWAKENLSKSDKLFASFQPSLALGQTQELPNAKPH